MNTKLEEINKKINRGEFREAIDELLVMDLIEEYRLDIQFISAYYHNLEKTKDQVDSRDYKTSYNANARNLINLVSRIANPEKDNTKHIDKVEKTQIESLRNSSEKEASSYKKKGDCLIGLSIVLIFIGLGVYYFTRPDQFAIFLSIAGIPIALVSIPSYNNFNKEKTDAKICNKLLAFMGPKTHFFRNDPEWFIFQKYLQ